MKAEISDKFVGYHYSNPRAYRSMQTKGIDGWTTFDFDDFAGLIPGRRFVRLGDGNSLPREAYDGVIEGLLEPEPKSWLENPEFPHFWEYLMHDVCRENEVMLLSFELRLEDKAYVVDRAHVERELYRESKGRRKLVRGKAFRKYWNSRIPVFEYEGGYSAPQLAIWSGITFNRLRVEWVKPSDEVWKRVLENNW